MQLYSVLLLLLVIDFTCCKEFNNPDEVDEFNKQGKYPWKAAWYTEHEPYRVLNDTNPEADDLRLIHSLPPHVLQDVLEYSSTVGDSVKREELPISYTVPTNCLPGIINQGSCGSCWAHASAVSLSVRRCLNTGTMRRVSEEDTLSCGSSGDGCGGGNAYMCYGFFKTDGFCFADQYPLTSTGSTENACKSTERLSYDREYVGQLYTVPGLYDNVWMRELLTAGPAYISMSVYTSFDAYRGGIYMRPADLSDEYRGGHAVVLVGWGSDLWYNATSKQYQNIPYWKVANSWGSTWWGELLYPDQPASATNTKGYFRIRRGRDPVTGESEVGIQGAMYAVQPCTTRAQCHTTCGPPPAAGANSKMSSSIEYCSGLGAGGSCSYSCNSGYVYRSEFTDNLSSYSMTCTDTKNGLTWGIQENACVASGSLMPNGYKCLHGSRCASGYCVDGYCCSSACDGNCQTCAGTPGTCTTSAFCGSSCPAPSQVTNGQVSCANYNYGTSCTYSCNTGYTLSGSATVTCLETGLWAPNAPICNANSCGTQPTIQYSSRSSCGTTYGETCNYTCITGYEMTGDRSVTCQANKSWSTLPVCSVRNCGTPSTIGNGTLASPCTNTTYGAKCTFSCNEGYTVSYQPNITCQSTGVWSTYPTCSPKSCGPLTAIANGGTSGSCSPTTTGVTCYYKCNTGYTLMGSNASVCQTNQLWSPIPYCQIITCPTPPSLDHGYLVSTCSYNYNQQCKYACDVGYHVQYTYGYNSNITCQANGTWTPMPWCKIANCSTPYPVSYATLDCPVTTYGSTCTYSCIAGYNMSAGVPSVTCQANATWTPRPTCTVSSCGTPPAIEKGSLYGSCTTTTNRTCVYSCTTGYRVSAINNITCLANTSWTTPTPTCTLIDCGAPPLVNNSMTVGGYRTTYNQQVMYSCNTGYTLSGSSNITCLSTGLWSTKPICNAVSCGSAPSVSYATVSCPVTTYGGIGTYSCNFGYRLEGSNTITCQANATWTPRPTCVYINCGTAPVVPGASLVAACTTTTYNRTCTYACNSTTVMSGSANITCGYDSQWSGPPMCGSSVVTCPAAPVVSNGVYTSTCGTLYNTRCTVTCNAGYLISGNATVTCTSSGSWSTPPACNYVSCPVPGITDGTVLCPNTAYGTSCSVSCNPGFTLSGSSSITCRSDGTWSSMGTCSATSCPYVPTISGGSIVGTCDTGYNSVCTFGCNNGYYMTGSPTITCNGGVFGGWSSPPTCTYKSCSPALVVSDATSVSCSTLYGGVCNYRCSDSRTLSTSCTRDGWSPAYLSCGIDAAKSDDGSEDSSTSAGTYVAIGGGVLVLAGAGAAAAFFYMKKGNFKRSSPSYSKSYPSTVEMSTRQNNTTTMTSTTLESSFDTISPEPRRPMPVPIKAKHKALYAYTAASDTELSFTAGDTIVVDVAVDSDGWAKGHVGSSSGFFPWSYVDSKPITETPRAVPKPVAQPVPKPAVAQPVPVAKPVPKPALPLPAGPSRAPTAALPKPQVPSARPPPPRR